MWITKTKQGRVMDLRYDYLCYIGGLSNLTVAKQYYIETRLNTIITYYAFRIKKSSNYFVLTHSF